MGVQLPRGSGPDRRRDRRRGDAALRGRARLRASDQPDADGGPAARGYAHGLGYALFEEATYADDGRFLAPSFLDYTAPSPPDRATEPDLVHTESPSSQNPEGFRGVGEAGTIAVPAAIANAVEDALHAAGRRIEVDMVPITPLRLWTLLRAGADE
jgi:carbon-monoxide dehydrogenase large subunit